MFTYRRSTRCEPDHSQRRREIKLGAFFRRFGHRRPNVFATPVALGLILLVGASLAANAQDDSKLWTALRQPGHFVIMRHALAPGTGDPSNFRIGDCDTQRNLSEGGRNQARRTGDIFRENGIANAVVYSSEWCRCLETARLLKLGDVTPLPSLNSFYEARSSGPAQTRELRKELLAMDLSRPVVLVTHQVNIRGLSGSGARSGEMVVMRRTEKNTLEVVGSLPPNATR